MHPLGLVGASPTGVIVGWRGASRRTAQGLTAPARIVDGWPVRPASYGVRVPVEQSHWPNGVNPSLWQRYRASIRALPPGELSRACLLSSEFLLYEEQRFSVYYAPFDYINRDASVALVGLSPGWQQMEIGFRTARAELASGRSAETALRAVKEQASFAGMRTRLCGWLDAVGLAQHLGLGSTVEMFGTDLLHTTSAVRYPVIRVDGKNWTGWAPRLSRTPALMDFVHRLLAPELGEVEMALVIPLGRAAGDAVRALVDDGSLPERRVLSGCPHPSGANAHGTAQFTQRRSDLLRQVRAWSRRP